MTMKAFTGGNWTRQDQAELRQLDRTVTY